MAGAWKARRWGPGLAGCLVLAGCLSVPPTPRSQAPEAARAIAYPRRDTTPAAPELRIPANAVAAADPEIPVVPVPPPPLRGDRTTQPPAPPLRQASAQEPAPELPPVSTRPTPSPETVRHSPRELVRLAAERYAGIDSYIVRLTRHEQVRGRPGPEEVILFKFRKEPWSLHFKWLSAAGHGREVIYVKGQYENKIHTLLAAGDAPLMPAGKRFAVAADSPLVRANSKHPITEAGIGATIERLERLLDLQERGDRHRGTLSVLPPRSRSEYPVPVEAIEHIVPPGVVDDLPRGGRRVYFFDPETHLPMLAIMYDERGQEVEYYFHDRMILSHLDGDDFNPDKVWAPVPTRRPGSTGGP
jgi:hypothetical protein